MINIKKIINDRIKGTFHLLSIILLMLFSFYSILIALNVANTSGEILRLLVNTFGILLFSFLIFWYGLIPTIFVALFLSIDFILYLLGLYSGISAIKIFVTLSVWLAAYELWKNSKTRQKISRR